MKNPVAKNLYTFNKPSVALSKRRSLQSEATLREMSEVVSEGQIDSQTMCFVSGSTVCWDESEDCCESVLNSVNCSSVSIDDCEGG